MDFGYDVIADVHGEAGALKRLLDAMDYRRSAGGVWSHRTRMAVFVGDLIDRGPEQVETLDIVRRMISAGAAHAVMGNHELNAIAWATEDGAGSHMRPRTEKNRAQHAAFLRQIGEDSPAHREVVDFFKTLPFWFESRGLRVVHACWHEASVDALRPHLDTSGRLKDAPWRWVEALRRNSKVGRAVDVLLKGPEITLPDGLSFVDKDGHERTALRARWWDPEATTYRRAAIAVPGDEVAELPDEPMTEDFRYSGELPVLFGHYWMGGEPHLVGERAACLDFSVARPDGSLVAYRWSGEPRLSSDNLVHVPATEPAAFPAP